MALPKLYHFTCYHGWQGIGDQGVVLPFQHPMLGVQVAWFTDIEDPFRDEVGLTSTILTCDRLEYRYEVTDRNGHIKLKPWLGSNVQARTQPHWQMDLHRFSQPKNWWIALEPVLVTLRPRNENYAEHSDQEKR